jgi:DNA polymerase-3 subunit beta
MRVIVQAKLLAAALGLAASLVDSKLKIPALWHARLAAANDMPHLDISANVLDFALKLSIPAMVEAAGEVAIPTAKLTALASSFPNDAAIKISTDDKAAVVACGRSRFKLPTLPIADVPPTPEVKDEAGRLEITREELLPLLSKPAFAISTDETRYYLHGILLHDTEDGLAAVATDGSRLARAVLPNAAGLRAQDHRLIVPRPAVRIICKLLGDKEIERLTLRRNRTLIEVAATKFAFISKLIDATYPDYRRIVPEPSGNTVVVDRTELVRAFARVQAATPESKKAPTVGLAWSLDDPLLYVCVPGWPDLADDPIAAEVSGNGRIAFKIAYGLELLGALAGDRVRIDAGDSIGSLVRVTDPDDPDFTIVQFPCAWFERSEAAA